jgi:hypothetical protein
VKSSVASALLCILFVAGCRNGSGASGIQGSDLLNRLPPPVATAFISDHPHSSVARTHARLFPDGSTRYQVIYLDATGQTRQANYYGDGRVVR